MIIRTIGMLLSVLVIHAVDVAAQAPAASVPDLGGIVGHPASELADVVGRFNIDLQSIRRRYDATASPDQRRRMREFYSAWSDELGRLDFERLSREGKVDYVLLANYLNYQRDLLGRQNTQRSETAALLPFADQLLALQDARRNLFSLDVRAASVTLAAVTRQIDSLRARIESPVVRGDSAPTGSARPRSAPALSKTVANRAAESLDQINRVMENWYGYYDGYDPIFSWWMKEPYRRLDESLERYARALRERIVGLEPPPSSGPGGARNAAPASGNDGPIIGDPIGEQGLREDLAVELIPYTPAELIAIAEREYAFSGQYSPLYQISYMIGGLQLRALHRELVESGRMGEREFHDAVLEGGQMPIAMVRARLGSAPLSRNGPAPWRFAENLPPPIPFTAR